MSTSAAVPDVVVLRELQSRALETVARRWGREPAGPAVRAGGGESPRAVLREAATATGLLAEAARQVGNAAAAAPVPWTQAVEIADAVSATALALRMLAELELDAIPGP